MDTKVDISIALTPNIFQISVFDKAECVWRDDFSTLDNNKFSEDLVVVFNELLTHFKSIKNIILTEGPGPFTSIRIITAFAKGVSLTLKSSPISFISPFATTALCLKKNNITLAISLRNGIYCCADCVNNIIRNKRLLKQRDLPMDYIDCSSLFFKNFSEAQYEIFKKRTLLRNYEATFPEPMYEFNPKFKSTDKIY